MSRRVDWRRWWGARGLWLSLLIIVAVCYFGSYWRHSINFTDEGGTEALVAKRLLAGERPFLDVTLGYNVLWFYPIVALFKLCGVSFVLLRAYCFALSTVSAVVGFLSVHRAGGRPWLAFLVGLMLVLVPGMTFKNYMPLLAVTNGACLLQFALAPRERPGRWLVLGGLLLGATLLIRIDVGLFVGILWFGAIVLRAWQQERPLWFCLRALALGAALVLALHAPVYLDAHRRGFAQPFLEQYANWPRSFVQQIEQRLATPHPVPVAPVAESEPAAPAAPGGVVVPERDTLRRKSFADLAGAKTPEMKQFIVLLYAPLLSLGLLTLWASVQLLMAWRRREDAAFQAALGALVLLGAALTDFPQYFFFRPDSPHLSEFSPGFWVAVSGGLLLLATGVRSLPRRLAVGAFTLLLLAHAGLYLWRMFPDRFTGTIAARKNRTQLFQGENGVRVYVTRHEIDGLRHLQQIVRDHTQREDYLVAWPYHPAVNLLTDRPTYEKNVYVDNAIAEPGWNAHAIARLERYQPAVVVVSDWAINDTEASRFSVWALPTKTWLQTHYVNQGTWLKMEIYTREP